MFFGHYIYSSALFSWCTEGSFLPSFTPFFLHSSQKVPSYLPLLLSSLIPSFTPPRRCLTSLLSSFFPSSLHSFLHSFLPSFTPHLPPVLLPSLLLSFTPSFTQSIIKTLWHFILLYILGHKARKVDSNVAKAEQGWTGGPVAGPPQFKLLRIHRHSLILQM